MRTTLLPNVPGVSSRGGPKSRKRGRARRLGPGPELRRGTGGPCIVRSPVQDARGEGQGDSCMARSNVSWVMVTWEPPPTALAGGNNAWQVFLLSQSSVSHSVPNRPLGYLVTAHPCYGAVATHPSGILFCFRFDFHVLDGAFHKSVRRSCDDWLHVVINFIGADEGAEAYVNGGEHHIRTSYKLPQNYTQGIGRIVIGRFSVEENKSYASLEMDELLFFNETLTAEEVTSLYNIW